MKTDYIDDTVYKTCAAVKPLDADVEVDRGPDGAIITVKAGSASMVIVMTEERGIVSAHGTDSFGCTHSMGAEKQIQTNWIGLLLSWVQHVCAMRGFLTESENDNCPVPSYLSAL